MAQCSWTESTEGLGLGWLRRWYARADPAATSVTRKRRADVGAEVDTRVDATSLADGEPSNASDNGERRRFSGGGWYQRLEGTNANTLVPV